MKLYMTLAWRNLWRNRRRTLITIASISFAVLFALLMRSINEGAYDQMITNAVQFHTGFIQVQDPWYHDEPSLDYVMPYDEQFEQQVLAADEAISYVVPRIETYALLAGDIQARGAMISGIKPDREHQLNELKDLLSEGRFFENGEPGVVLGRGLSRRLDAGIGDTIVVLGQGRFGVSAAAEYEVIGLIDHRMRELDNNAAFLSLAEAQWLFDTDGGITSLLVMPEGARYVDRVKSSLQRELDTETYAVLDWQELMPDLLSMMELDRISDGIFSGVLYLIIGFGMFGTILAKTMERKYEYGMMLSLGMQRTQLSFVAILEAVWLSIIGVISGIVISMPVLLYFYFNPITLTGDMADMYEDMGFEPILPASMDVSIFVSQTVIVLVLAFLVSLYPIRTIYRLNPQEVRA